jgi:SAM-dependent methyltransferase
MDSPPQEQDGAERAPRNTRLKVIAIVIAISLLAGLASRQLIYWQADPSNYDGTPLPRPEINAPFITSHEAAVEKMVELAKLTPDDLVYDLGCGDGRIVIAAVKKSGCRGVGIDIDPERVAESIENAQRQGVADHLDFREQDVFTVDLREADVAMMYLTGWMIAKLEPQFEQMKPGSRVVTLDFWIEQVRPHRVLELGVESENKVHSIFLYTLPLNRDATMEKGKPPRPADGVIPGPNVDLP